MNARVSKIAGNDRTSTDRLHGVILSLLAQGLPNGNPKVESTVKTWLTSCPLVFYLEGLTVDSLKRTLSQVERLDKTKVTK